MEELRNAVSKIRVRVSQQNRKPLTNDVFVLLNYIDTLESRMEQIKEKTIDLIKQQTSLDKLLAESEALNNIDSSDPKTHNFIKSFVVNNKEEVLSSCSRVRKELVEKFGEHHDEVITLDEMVEDIKKISSEDDEKWGDIL